MTQLIIPDAWRNLLATIQTVCPEAVIAGGCLRDLDNGEDVKDIDVFIPVQGERDAVHFIDILSENGFTFPDDAFDYDEERKNLYPDDIALEVVAVVDALTSPMPYPWVHPVQFIFVRWDTAKIVERFDYGLSQIAFDGDKLTCTTAYSEDKVNKVFRIVREGQTPLQLRSSVKRYARLVKRSDIYADFDFMPHRPDDDFICVS